MPAVSKFSVHVGLMKNSALKSPKTSDPIAEIAAIGTVLSSKQLELADALEFVVERACALTKAHGAAVALQEENGVVCRATTGQAPPLGAKLQPDSGISGECLRTGVSLVCEDANTDTRVDRDVCKALRIEATAVVPLRAGIRTIGLLQVFAREPRAFQQDHVLILNTLAEIIVELVRASGEGGYRDGSTSERRPVQSEVADKTAKVSAPGRSEFQSTSNDAMNVIVRASAPHGISTSAPVTESGEEKDTSAEKSARSRGNRFWIDLGFALGMAMLLLLIGAVIWSHVARSPSVQAKMTSDTLKVGIGRRGAPAPLGSKVMESTPGLANQIAKAGEQKNDARSFRTHPPSHATANRVLVVSHRRVTDPLSEYEIQSLNPDNVSQLMTKAQSGDPGAELALGSAYELGRAVTQNCEKAARWIMKSASAGNEAAEYNLGLRYAQGDGVQQNQVEAERWLNRAISSGYLARRASYAMTSSAN